MTGEDLREQLAAIEHERWADWQRYLHSRCERRDDGSLVIPAGWVAALDRQIATPYEALTDEERGKDLREVDRYWPLIEQYATEPTP